MSQEFREFIKKIGSGTHTGRDLTRQEAAIATEMMLTQVATPAQIGAFMIAHRIKRPTPEELLGMLDAYDTWGWRFAPIATDYPVTVFNVPYDGRSRTAPILPLTALILATAGCPVIMHGGDRWPTKYGVSLIDSWRSLGVDWSRLTTAASQRLFPATKLGFMYLPRDFPQAAGLLPYRDQIGKRPPLATVEIMWPPYAGPAHVVSGFVHPPTEERTIAAYAIRGERFYTTVKGLEGSTDLPCDRTAILGLMGPTSTTFERVLLSPRDYDVAGDEVPLSSLSDYATWTAVVLTGAAHPLTRSTVWNSAFYLWRCGVVPDLPAGLDTASTLLTSGAVARHLTTLQTAIAHHTSASV